MATLKGTSTNKLRRLPGSTIVPGTIQAPRKARPRDRIRAVPTGRPLDWRKASARVNGA